MKKWQGIVTTVISFATVILFAIFNGLFIMWDRAVGKVRKGLSKKWHAVGMTIKVLVGISMLIVLYPQWWYMLPAGMIYFVLSWSAYNSIINSYLGEKWYYIGGTSVIDVWGRKHPVLFWGSQGLIILLAIGIIIYMIIK